MTKDSVLIIGHYGGHNTGDEIMATSLLDYLAERNLDICVLSKLNSDVVESERVTYISKNEPVQIIRAILASRLVLVGGGTHIHDDYSGWRLVRHLRYMVMFLIVGIVARICGRPFLWVGAGFVPQNKSFTRLLSRFIARVSNEIVVRDSSSYDLLKNSTKTCVIQGFDLAASARLAAITPPPDDMSQDILGLSVMNLNSIHTLSDIAKTRFNNDLLRAITAVFEQRANLKIRIFVIRGGDREDDIEISRFFYEALAEVDLSRVELVNYDPDPLATMRKVKECEFFIATRFHSALFSVLGDCYSMFVAYHQKLKDLAADVQLEAGVIDIESAVYEKTLFSSIVKMLDGDPQYRPKRAINQLQAMANENFLAIERYL